METLTINIPDKKSALVKKLLKELGVTIDTKVKRIKTPNALTAKTIGDCTYRYRFGQAYKGYQ